MRHPLQVIWSSVCHSSPTSVLGVWVLWCVCGMYRTSHSSGCLSSVMCMWYVLVISQFSELCDVHVVYIGHLTVQWVLWCACGMYRTSHSSVSSVMCMWYILVISQFNEFCDVYVVYIGHLTVQWVLWCVCGIYWSFHSSRSSVMYTWYASYVSFIS